MKKRLSAEGWKIPQSGRKGTLITMRSQSRFTVCYTVCLEHSPVMSAYRVYLICFRSLALFCFRKLHFTVHISIRTETT